MIDFLFDFGLFAAKTIFIAGSIIAVTGFIIVQISQTRRSANSEIPLEIQKVNQQMRSLKMQLQRELLDKKKFKALNKEEKKQDKADLKLETPKPRAFVLDFDGDIRATPVQNLREEITAILSIAVPGDEVVLRLESGGGLVTSYGLAASQLARLKTKSIRLTICVDKVAASGGYMMACVADRIIAAPFAILGSIGVIAQIPNFNKVLKKHDVDYREVTAGEFKRTVTMFGEITETGMSKFKSQIEETHSLFKSFVQQNRPSLDIGKVATGEYWYGTQALELGLADELLTSDDYIFNRCAHAEVYHLHHVTPKKLSERISESFGQTAYRLAHKIWRDIDQSKYGH